MPILRWPRSTFDGPSVTGPIDDPQPSSSTTTTAGAPAKGLVLMAITMDKLQAKLDLRAARRAGKAAAARSTRATSARGVPKSEQRAKAREAAARAESRFLASHGAPEQAKAILEAAKPEPVKQAAELQRLHHVPDVVVYRFTDDGPEATGKNAPSAILAKVPTPGDEVLGGFYLVAEPGQGQYYYSTIVMHSPMGEVAGSSPRTDRANESRDMAADLATIKKYRGKGKYFSVITVAIVKNPGHVGKVKNTRLAKLARAARKGE